MTVLNITTLPDDLRRDVWSCYLCVYGRFSYPWFQPCRSHERKAALVAVLPQAGLRARALMYGELTAQ
jgi:hypothetical protein